MGKGVDDPTPIIQFRNLWVREKKSLNAPIDEKSGSGKKKDPFLLKGLSGDFYAGQHTGILYPPQAPKDTLLRLLCGIQPPDHGEVRRKGLVSWPLGQAYGFHAALSGSENIKFISRIFDVDPRYALDFVGTFMESGKLLRTPFQRWTWIARQLVALSLSFAIPFDFYVGEAPLSYGEPNFRKKCDALVAKRLQTSTFIIFSRHAQELARFQKNALLFNDGHLWTFTSYAAMCAYRDRGGPR